MLRQWLLPSIVWFVVAASVVASAAPNKPEPADAPNRFVGFSASDDLVTGDVGYPGLYRPCQDLFGPQARMCTIEEFILSPNAAGTGDESTAFLNPWPSTGEANDILFRSCNGFTDSSVSGTGVTDAGGITQGVGCGTPRRVTCCIPVQ